MFPSGFWKSHAIFLVKPFADIHNVYSYNMYIYMHTLHIGTYTRKNHVTFISPQNQNINKTISCCAPFYIHAYTANLESKQTCFNVLKQLEASNFHTHTCSYTHQNMNSNILEQLLCYE